MIVVEGPDGAGKTTLCRELAQHFGLRINNKDKEDRQVPGGPPKRSARETAWEALGVAVAGHEPVVIYDRLFLSELIYGPIVKASCEFKGWERQQFERVCAAMGIPFIVCLPPKKVVFDNVDQNDEQWEKAKQNIGALYDGYANFVPPLLNKVIYDFTCEPPQRVFGMVETYLSKRKERSW